MLHQYLITDADLQKEEEFNLKFNKNKQILWQDILVQKLRFQGNLENQFLVKINHLKKEIIHRDNTVITEENQKKPPRSEDKMFAPPFTTLHVGKINGGNNFNVIADEVNLEGTTRAYTEKK